MIVFTALNRTGNHIDFAYDLNSIEADFDFLSDLVAQGYTLLHVELLDGTGRMNLPLAAFDGLPFLGVIKTLQQEWQAVLSQPGEKQAPSPSQEELIRLTRQRINQIAVIRATQERMLACSTRWLQQTQTSSMSNPHKSQLINRYEALIEAHAYQLRLTRLRSQLVTTRMNALLTSCPR